MKAAMREARDIIADWLMDHDVNPPPGKSTNDQADAILTALSSAGLAVVPVEPSFEMLAAFNTSVQASLTYVRMKYDNVTLRRAIAAAIAAQVPLPPLASGGG